MSKTKGPHTAPEQRKPFPGARQTELTQLSPTMSREQIKKNLLAVLAKQGIEVVPEKEQEKTSTRPLR